METEVIHNGKILWYDQVKKFGYVTDIETDSDYFFHVTALKNYASFYPAEDDKVTFQLDMYKNRICAVAITKNK
jgi:cold shock CspA family protein